ncbi:hypothetical protein [Williamsia sp. CHRR-6]|uniref:hypothetical protein n=1 Tax=Williamsia sp. CHRR-6 TaxID=2835871 RepID=UPI002023D2DE|nr:hypothetical protein [Williamsia sp. CHRR-6]
MTHDSPATTSSVIRTGISDSLRTSLYDGEAAAIRTLLPQPLGAVTWYGQQEAHHIAYRDIARRVSCARFTPQDDEILDVLVTLAAATGWWWAFDDVCVMADGEPANGSCWW